MKPFAHQEKAIKEAIYNLTTCRFHALFMEIGTGKSKTIIDIAQEMYTRGLIDAVIISAPKSLVGTWREQHSIHAYDSKFIAFDSSKSKSTKWQDEFYYIMNSDMLPYFFINTEAFQTMPKILTQSLNDFLIIKPNVLLVIDESSDIKSPNANRSKNLTKFGIRCRYRMISTGTEITNSVLDLYQQFEFLNPGFWGFKSFYFFKNYYAILEERYLSGGRTFKEIIGFRKLNELQDRIKPYISRARKADCLDLPKKIYANMPVKMEGESARIYKEMKNNLISMLDDGTIISVSNKIGLFMKFRQIVGGTLAEKGIIDSHPSKLQALVGEIEDSSEQAIIWCCFREEIDLLMDSFGKIAVRFDGATMEKDRQLAVEEFVLGKKRLFIANPAVAGQGINLQSCHLQYWYSLPTSAKQLEQAEGRNHRAGQTETCVYKKILCENTVDYRIAQILEEKKDIMSTFREGTVSDIIDLI